jgi:hypothetical protein
MSPAHADVASTVRDSIEARNSTPITPERSLRGVSLRGVGSAREHGTQQVVLKAPWFRCVCNPGGFHCWRYHPNAHMSGLLPVPSLVGGHICGS